MSYLFRNNNDEQNITVEQQPYRRNDGDGHAERKRHCRLFAVGFRLVHLHAVHLCPSLSTVWRHNGTVIALLRHLTADAALHRILADLEKKTTL